VSSTAPSLQEQAQHHLEQAIGWLIRECQARWDRMSKDERSLSMDEYRRLLGLLGHASGPAGAGNPVTVDGR
jgi:hypothetical protein